VDTLQRFSGYFAAFSVDTLERFIQMRHKHAKRAIWLAIVVISGIIRRNSIKTVIF
jgi:hypothetical protein